MTEQGQQFPAPNTDEWRYGLQRNAQESHRWHQQRIRRPSAVMWRQHQGGHVAGAKPNCLFCKQAS